MEQVNTIGIYWLGKWLDSVFLHAKMPIKVNPQAWIAARAYLDILIAGDATLKLNESAFAAKQLRDAIDLILDDFGKNSEFRQSEAQVTSFNAVWGAFEQALGIDLGRAPIFFVTQKGIYDTPALINAAENAVMDDVIKTLPPGTIRDINQAGRCLAFELSTAAGYHSLRATEGGLRQYYEQVLKKPAEKVRMKQAIDELVASDQADKKTMAVLDQVRDLHRNPLDHPGGDEVFLEKSEAMELFSICIGAISAMTRQIAKLKVAK